LTAFAQGADWMLAGWRGLRALLETETRWGDFERLTALLLLGTRPEDALRDPAAVRLFLACHACDDRSGSAADYFYRAGAAGHPRPYYDDLFKALLSQRPATAEAGRAVLRALAEEQIARLEALKAEELDELNELDREEAITRARFDDSKEGAALRRQETALERDLHRALADLVKLQKHAGRARPGDGCGNEPIAEVSDIEELASDEVFESVCAAGAGAADPLTPTLSPEDGGEGDGKPTPVAPDCVGEGPGVRGSSPTPDVGRSASDAPASDGGVARNEPIAEVGSVSPVTPITPALSARPVADPLGVRMVDGAGAEPITDVFFRHGRVLK
jgi:hypothetical protein